MEAIDVRPEGQVALRLAELPAYERVEGVLRSLRPVFGAELLLLGVSSFQVIGAYERDWYVSSARLLRADSSEVALIDLRLAQSCERFELSFTCGALLSAVARSAQLRLFR